MSGKIYTPDDVAALLQISKHTVYELIKRKELAAFKVGNKMRIEEKQLETYKSRQSTFLEAPEENFVDMEKQTEPEYQPTDVVRLAGSHDLLLEKFCQSIFEDPDDPMQIQATYIGSMEGCMALYRGDCDVAAIHLFDPSTREYNLPFIRQLFVSEDISVIHFTKRRQGMIVAGENPKKISGWMDLSRDDIRFVNRQKGAGTRQLLDYHLHSEGIKPDTITGYENEEWTHYAAAMHVLQGNADVTVGIEPVARMLGLRFIPLVEERFDLVFRWTANNRDRLQRLYNMMQSEKRKKALEEIPGYSMAMMGEVLYERISSADRGRDVR